MIYEVRIDSGVRNKFSEPIMIDDSWFPQQVKCEFCKRTWDKPVLFEPNRVVEYALTNKKNPDFMSLYVNLISENCKNILTNENVTGFTVEKVKMYSKRDLRNDVLNYLKDEGVNINNLADDVPNYYRIIIDKTHMAKFHNSTNIVLAERCDACGFERYETKGMGYVDTLKDCILSKDNLVKEDLFYAEGYGYTLFSSEKFKQICQLNNLTGITFKEVSVVFN